MSEPTNTTATFGQWHMALCQHARERGGSASTLAIWMTRLYQQGLTPSEAWEVFSNDEVMR